METRLTLGRHAVARDALVLEYTRWETEEAAREAARAAGAVGLMAAFGAFGVIAVAALNATSAASPIVGYGAPLFAAFPCADRGGRGWAGQARRAVAVGLRFQSRGCRRGADGVPTGVPTTAAGGIFNVPGSNPRVVRRRPVPRLGCPSQGTTSTPSSPETLRSALANAGYVDAPKCPAQSALAREPRMRITTRARRSRTTAWTTT